MGKQYNTKTLQRNINGAAPEEGGKGKEGLYRHPEAIDASTGKLAELICLSDPLFGNSAADAAVQIGYEWVGPVPEGAVKTLEFQTVEANAGQADSLKGLTARMNQLEGVAERNKELEKQVADLQAAAALGAKTDHPAVVDATAQAKADAEAEVAGRQATDTPPAAPEVPEGTENPAGDEDESDEEDEIPAKALSQQNTTELVATAKAEGVELTEDHDTKAKIREAIEAKRNETKGE